MQTRILGALCAFILCVILAAGLWPFRAPKNNVEWLKGGNGLQFGPRGIAVSAKRFGADSPTGSCSLEIWLEPGRMGDSGTMLAFDSSPDARFPFSLRQFGESLAIQRASVDEHGAMERLWFKTDRVFEKGKRVVLTITGSPNKTAVYVNGVPVNVSAEFGLESGDLTGQLVLGSSTIRDSWQGQVTGLAVYDFALSALQVETHFEHWTQGQRPVMSGEQAPTALFQFDERAGSVVHDRMTRQNDLLIRDRYYLLHPPLLEPTWYQFRSRWGGWRSWSYWSDVSLNIAGFIPAGFFFTAYLSLIRLVRRPRITVVILGLALSLTIELLQYFLPTRESSMTDVITNTIGTMAGVALYRPVWMQSLLTKPYMAGIRRWMENSQLLHS
jgi:hypothetical protein